MRNKSLFLLLTPLFLHHVTSRPSSDPIFTDITQSAGVVAVTPCGSADKRNIVESLGNGVGLLDYDHDGNLDLFVPRGAELTPGSGSASITLHTGCLFRNLGDGRFTEVTREAGITVPVWAIGCVVGDYDNDGWEDLFVTGYGRNLLYRNRGDRTFEEVAEKAGVASAICSTGAAFGDFNGDGKLDLYVAQYVDTRVEEAYSPQARQCLWYGIPVFCGPRGLKPAPDLLFINKGGGSFKESSVQAHLRERPAYYGLGASVLDFNNDRKPDIYVCNDATPAYLWMNNGDAAFTDVAPRAGAAYDENGKEQARMGVAIGDYDRNGYFDIFTTNFAMEFNTLFQNEGNGFFKDVSLSSGIARDSYRWLGWGTQFVDFNNDGWLDLLVANGHVYPGVKLHALDQQYEQPLQLFMNERARFRESSRSLASLPPKCYRGAAFGDLDNDGDIDVVLTVIDGPVVVLRNDGPAQNFINLSLEGTKSNRDAIGARVEIQWSGGKQVAEVRAGDSFMSSSDRRLHFGVGTAAVVDRVKVIWPYGGVEQYENLRSNSFYRLREGGRAPETLRRLPLK